MTRDGLARYAFLVAAAHAAGACQAQNQPAANCKLVEPVSIRVLNDRHPANRGLQFGRGCVRDETVRQDVCLPAGVVAGHLDVQVTRETGQGRYMVEPSAQGPHCKTIVVRARPDHSGMDPNYLCRSGAVTQVEASLSPAARVALCD